MSEATPGTDVKSDGHGPAPVIAGDMIVYYNNQAGAFQGRRMFLEEDSGAEDRRCDQVIWQCRIHRAGMSPASSPVHIGAYLYFVTEEPRYLHRIALDSGRREVCKIVLDGEWKEEIPGQIIPVCPPLILPDRADFHSDPAKKTICLFTSEGILFVEMQDIYSGGEPELTARFFRSSLAYEGWNRPVIAGPYLVATASMKPSLLVVDLSTYPHRLVPEFPSFQEVVRCDSFSPCLTLEKEENGSQRDEVCWLAHDLKKKKSQLVRFQPPSTFRTQSLDFVEEAAFGSRYCSQPVTDGNVLCVASCKEGKRGITVIYEKHSKFKILDMEFYTQNCIFVGNDAFLIATPEYPILLNPHSAEIIPEAKLPFHHGRVSPPVARPVVGRGRVFIQTKDFISCYSIITPSEG